MQWAPLHWPDDNAVQLEDFTTDGNRLSQEELKELGMATSLRRAALR